MFLFPINQKENTEQRKEMWFHFKQQDSRYSTEDPMLSFNMTLATHLKKLSTPLP